MSAQDLSSEAVTPASTPLASDPLVGAEQALVALDAASVERHPQIFTHFDELLREALESPPQVGSG